jgi:hypothetical protein
MQAPDVPIMDEDNDRSLELEEQALKQQYETELGHDVQFGHLQIQTSNIKVSFASLCCNNVGNVVLVPKTKIWILIRIEYPGHNDPDKASYTSSLSPHTIAAEGLIH